MNLIFRYFALLWTVSSSALAFPLFSSSNPRSDIDIKYILKYLENFGYLETVQSNELRSSEDIRGAVLKFQIFANLENSGSLDENTIRKITQPRCGVPDFPLLPTKENVKLLPARWTQTSDSILDGHSRKKRYVLIGKWPKTDITYRFGTYTEDLGILLQRQAIKKAFAVWSQDTPLTFKEGWTGDEDIVLSFLRGFHNDGYPFDGNGHTLAHAFFPGQGKRSGDAHFDEDEDWTYNSEEGTDLFMVAAHEFGHALGLGHSSRLDSIMLPFYQGNKREVILSEDDRNAINHLYGIAHNDGLSNSDGPSFPMATRPPYTDEWWNEGMAQNGNEIEPRTASDLCHYSFDAVASIRGEVYFIKGGYFWRILQSGHLYKTSGSTMASFWRDFPNVKVDAVYERPDARIVFFSGNQYYEYLSSYKKDVDSPKPISDYGLPMDEGGIDAAMVWAVNRRTYFFKGNKFWKYDEYLSKMETGYPREISETLSGIPNDLDATLTSPLDKHTYFIKGLKAWRFDDDLLSVSPGYPKHIGEQWLDCNSTIYEADKPTIKTSKTDIVVKHETTTQSSSCKNRHFCHVLYFAITLIVIVFPHLNLNALLTLHII